MTSHSEEQDKSNCVRVGTLDINKLVEQFHVSKQAIVEKTISFKKIDVDRAPDRHPQWIESVKGYTGDELLQVEIGFVKSTWSNSCDIWLKNTNGSCSSIYWTCTVDQDQFKGRRSGLLINDFDSRSVRCDLLELPAQWKITFSFFSTNFICRDILDDEHSVDIFKIDKSKAKPDSSVLKVEWMLDSFESIKKVNPGESIISEVFGDVNEDTAMQLVVYPNELNKVMLYLRYLHLPQEGRKCEVHIEGCTGIDGCSIGVHRANFGEEHLLFDGREWDRDSFDLELLITIELNRIGFNNDELEEKFLAAIKDNDSEKVRSFLQSNKYFTIDGNDVTDDLFSCCFLQKDLSVLDILLEDKRINFNNNIIYDLAMFCEDNNFKLSEEILKQFFEKLEFYGYFKPSMISTLDGSIMNSKEDIFCEKKFLSLKATHTAVTDFISKLNPSLTDASSSEQEPGDKVNTIAEIVANDAIKDLEDDSHIFYILHNMDEELQDKVFRHIFDNLNLQLFTVSYKSPPQCESFLSPFYYKFPFLCLRFGKFRLIQKYFELATYQDHILHAAFVIDKLRVLKVENTLTDTQREAADKTVKFLDIGITQIVEHVMEKKYGMKTVIRRFMNTKYQVIDKKSVMDILIENECLSFMQSDHSIEAMNELWKGTYYQEKWSSYWYNAGRKCKGITWTCFQWLSYIPFHLFVSVMALLLLIPSCCEKSVRLCRRSCKNHVSDADDAENISENTENGETGLNSLKLIKKLKIIQEKKEKKLFPPVVRFFMDSVMQLVFIILLSYFVVRDVHYYISVVEIFIYICIVTHMLEEFVQIALISSCREYLDAWNVIDWFAIVLLLIGCILKNIPGYYLFDKSALSCTDDRTNQCILQEANDKWLYIARVFLVSGVLFYFIKFIRMTSAFSRFGPTLKMIGDMIIVNLLPFLVILLVFVASFGVAFSALTFPNSYTAKTIKDNTTDLNWFSFSKAFIFSFYGLAGQYPILDLTENLANSDNDELANYGKPHEWSRFAIAYFFLPIYIVIVNILLLNLLIALFSSTVQRIEEFSKAYWHIQKYKLTKDYEIRSVLPPPLNFITIIYNILLKICELIDDEGDANGLEEDKLAWFLLFSYGQTSSMEGKKTLAVKEKEGKNDSDFGREIDRLLDEKLKATEERLEKNQRRMLKKMQSSINKIDAKMNELLSAINQVDRK